MTLCKCDLDPCFFGATLVAVLWLLSGKSGGSPYEMLLGKASVRPTCSRWGTLEPGLVGVGKPNCWCHLYFYLFVLFIVSGPASIAGLCCRFFDSFPDPSQRWMFFLWSGKMRWSCYGLINYLLVVSAPKVIRESLLNHESYTFG